MKPKKAERLKVGDNVLWRGSFGSDPAKEAKVEGIEICKSGSKYGKVANSVSWDTVNSRNVVVSLDNGHWAYGNQITQIKKK